MQGQTIPSFKRMFLFSLSFSLFLLVKCIWVSRDYKTKSSTTYFNCLSFLFKMQWTALDIGKEAILSQGCPYLRFLQSLLHIKCPLTNPQT